MQVSKKRLIYEGNLKYNFLLFNRMIIIGYNFSILDSNRKLREIDKSQLFNLVPQTAEEAFSLIPDIKDK